MGTTENIEIRAKSSGFRVVKRHIDNLGIAANNATRGIFLMQRALFVLGGAGILRGLSRQVDMLTNYENRLRLTATSAKNLEEIQKSLFQVARDSRTSFEAVAEIYTRTALSVRELGISQQETIRFTESLSKATIISGASAREAHAALIQLGQGMASNTLRGDELRSVLEQLPFVADVISKHFGVTRGELRELGAEGKISAKDILDAFRNAEEEIDRLFANTVPTISQALSVANSNWLQYVDNVDDASNASAILAGAIITISENIDVIISSLLTLGAVFTAVLITKGLKAVQSYTKGLIAAGAASARFTEIELLRSEAGVTRTATRATEIAQTNALLTLKQAEISQNVILLRQELLAAEFSVVNGQARNILTGQFVTLDAAKHRLEITSQRLALTESLEAKGAARLVLAREAQVIADSSAATASLRLTKAMLVSNSTGAKLARTFPLLTGAVLGLGKALKALWAFVLANPLLIIIAALAALYVAISSVKTISERTAVTNEFLAKTLEKIRDSANDASKGIEGLDSNLVELSRNEAIIRLDDGLKSVRQSMNDTLIELEDLSSISFLESAVGVTDEMVSALSELNNEVAAGKLNYYELSDAVSELVVRFNDPAFSRYIEDLVKNVQNTVEASDATRKLEAIMRVLNGTASNADRVLLGLADAANTLARGAGAAAGAIASLSARIPELAAAAKVQGELADASADLARGQTEISEAIASSSLSLSEAANRTRILNELYTRAVSEIDGTAEATRKAADEQANYNRQAELASLTGLSRSLRQAEITYAEIRDRAVEAGSSQAELNSLASNYASIQAGIRRDASSSGGGGSVASDLASIVEGMTSQLDILELVNSERTAGLEILKIEEELKRSLTEQEKELIKVTLEQISAATAQGAILDTIIGSREKAQEQLTALNALYEQGKIGIEDYTVALRGMEAAAGRAAGTLMGSFKAAISDAIVSAAELGDTLGNVLVGATDRAADAIVEFARTGKFNLKSFFSDLFADITKLIAKQLILKALGFVLGIPLGGPTGGGGLLGLANGGSIMPSGPGSTDSQVVSFIKRPDERVDVLTPGQQADQRNGSSGGGTTIVQSPPVNVALLLSSSDIVGAFDSDEGETLIINTLERNASTVRSIVGG